MSATIGGLLEQVSPVLQRVVAVLRAANQAKDAVKGRLVDDLEQAQARMEKEPRPRPGRSRLNGAAIP